MISVVSYILFAFTVLLGIPVAIFLFEVTAALALTVREPPPEPNKSVRPSVAVVVPARNESLSILPTIKDIKGELLPGDRLLVVADNCSDDTAAVASAAGAEAIERFDHARIGKGFALDFGLRHLSLNPPAVVIIIDADCRVVKGTIERLAIKCATTDRPVQALYLMIASDKAAISYRIAEFAWRIKNWVRPLGLRALSLPCQLMGTGMAFPWNIIRSADVATGSIVEDLKLGLELARSGSPPIFFPSAMVTSLFPMSVEGGKTQRRRWEEGHVSLILTRVAHFIYEAIVCKNIGLLALTLDVTVPPISLLVIFLAGMSFVAGVATVFGVSSAVLVILGSYIVALALAILLSWLRYGRDILPLSQMISVVSYIFEKIPNYLHVIFGSPASEWNKTDRKNSE